MKRYFTYGSLLAALLFIAFFTQEPRAQTQQSAGLVPYKSITPGVESAIERTRIRVLVHISRARSDIHGKDWARAQDEAAEAVRLTDSIRDDLSTVPAKDLIAIARKHLEYEPSQQVLRDDFPPIFASLNQVSVYLPTDKALLHVGKAEEHLQSDNKQKADRELALADKSLIVIEVELPLLRSQQYVVKAEGYLAARDAEKADAALQAAEQRAMALAAAMKSPLFLAKQNLWLAFRNYSTARGPEAKTYLERARYYLGMTAGSASALEKEEAGKLSQEIADLEKRLPNQGKAAESALKMAFEKCEALAERSAAFLSAGLSEVETTLKGEDNLIEARLHVAFAETYQVTVKEPDKAVKELDTAHTYLQKALAGDLAGPAHRKIMGEVDRLLLDLKAAPGKSGTDVRERYDTAMEQLGDLIEEL